MEDYLSRYYNEHETTEPVYNTTMGKNNQTNKLNGNKNQTKNEINNKFQPKTTDVKNEDKFKKEAYKENTRNSNDNQKQNARTNNTEVNKYFKKSEDYQKIAANYEKTKNSIKIPSPVKENFFKKIIQRPTESMKITSQKNIITKSSLITTGRETEDINPQKNKPNKNITTNGNSTEKYNPKDKAIKEPNIKNTKNKPKIRETSNKIPETIKIKKQISKGSKKEILEAMKSNENNTTR
jgi:hypothetical protein